MTKLAICFHVAWRISRFSWCQLKNFAIFFLEIMWRILRVFLESPFDKFRDISLGIIWWNSLFLFPRPILKIFDIFTRLIGEILDFLGSIVLRNSFFSVILRDSRPIDKFRHLFPDTLTKLTIFSAIGLRISQFFAISWRISPFLSTISLRISRFPTKLLYQMSRFFPWDHLTNFVVFRRDHLANFAIFSPRSFGEFRYISPRSIVGIRDIFPLLVVQISFIFPPIDWRNLWPIDMQCKCILQMILNL